MRTDAFQPNSADDGGGKSSRQHSLPSSLARITTFGVYTLIAGVVLMGLSFLTNPVPDPSFPWATLPKSLRITYTQPRIEHWPVTYTVGLWLVVFTLPLVLLHAYHRYRSRVSLRPSTWLVGLPVTVMFAFTTYCRFFWPKLHPPTWNAPSYTFVCWRYCSTYDPFWSDFAYAIAVFGVGVTSLAYRNSSYAKYALATFGVLAFPLGVPALFDAYRRHV
ncbi:hypothetical protein [Haloarcula nitratireducens]|uniref:Uncharacterized protein n=1 Tax=Haloarcula nitratireducens TaxID=2487749 RepID=A0AAW4PL55_9EURY|nr:hypothetical protein [Halomicroarcula nitratireducens]MBX0298318.1 hypothetical protein [Halomicroarcula nitratireducens]